MNERVYWIDAGVLIEAQRRAYPMAMLPQFWQFLHMQLEAGTVRMPRIAFEEITDAGRGDELAQWCKARKKLGLCMPETKAVQARYGQIATHVQAKHPAQHARDFLNGADGWVIAYAFATQGIVVTQENERSYRSKVKIPTVAKFFTVPHCDTYKMLAALRADFSKSK